MGACFALATFGSDARLTSANRHFLQLFDYALEALVGRDERALMADDEAAATFEAMWRDLREAKTVSAVVPRRRRTGDPVWVRATYIPTLAADGTLDEVVVVMTDASEETLRASLDRGQVEAINASYAVVHFDTAGTILQANDVFLRITGYEADEIEGQPHRRLMHDEDAVGEAYARFWAALAEGRQHAAEVRRIGKGGREVWLQATYSPVRDPRGRVIRIVKYATDITGEKLRQADYEWQIAAIRKSHATITFDLDGIILDANEVFLSAMGYTLDEIRGRHHRMFVEPAESHGLDYAALWRDLKRGRYRVGQYRRFGKGGREIWLQATYNPIFDTGGRPIKVVKYAYVITDDKNQEADHRGQIAAIHKSQCVISFGLDGTILDANDNFLDAMGYRLGDVLGRHHSMFLDVGEAEDEGYRAFWVRLGRGEPQAGEFRRVGRDGRRRWLQATYNPILDLRGRPLRIVKYATDVTKEKERRADFESQIAAISKSQGVVTLSLEGTILDANERFLSCLGYELGDLEGQHHSVLVPQGEAQSADYAAFWSHLRSGQFHSGMYKRVAKDGREVWLQATYNPILGPDGQPVKVIKFATDVTANVSLAAAFADASRQALCDATTALPNRLRLSQFLSDALREPRAGIAVLYLDLDRFKPINDTYGHAAGDRVLGEIADRLRHIVADDQLVARVGGDEFVVVAPNLGEIAEVDRLGRRIIEAVARPIRHQGSEIVLTASVGIAMAPEDGATAEDLLNKADIALYNSKRDGRATFSFYGSGTTERTISDRDRLTEMRDGLARGEFVLDYQPRFDTRDRSVRGLEALLRWDHPVRGRLLPADFVPFAERSTVMARLGERVLATACRQAADLPGLGMSVNVSAVQIREAGFVETVAATLARAGLAAHRLELEIGEGALLEDAPHAMRVLADLKALGVRLILDGFGTGQSSLHHLHGFAFDGVKIDRTVVADLEDNGVRSLVPAMISCGRSLGLSVTAVGVETFGQLARLTHEQCTEVQGFLLARPMEGRGLVEFIERSMAARKARRPRGKDWAQTG